MDPNPALAPSPWLAFALGSLATFRLALLVSKETGPAFIFRKLRRLPAAGTATKEGLSCQWCVSMYSSALVTCYYYWQGLINGSETPLYWLSFSTVAVCLNQTFTKGLATK